jgi:hypothetical protein
MTAGRLPSPNFSDLDVGTTPSLDVSLAAMQLAIAGVQGFAVSGVASQYRALVARFRQHRRRPRHCRDARRRAVVGEWHHPHGLGRVMP